jgi:hypothetical protein
MKNALFIIVFFLTPHLLILNAQDLAANHIISSSEVDPSVLTWDKTDHNFGAIPQGVPVEAEFTLTNHSKEILLITEVKTTCGCTVAGYSKDPILPGESTVIEATFNAKKEGQINKTIKVFTSLNDDFIPLRLKGEVVKKKN